MTLNVKIDRQVQKNIYFVHQTIEIFVQTYQVSANKDVNDLQLSLKNKVD